MHLDPVCVCTFVFVEIKTKRETVALRMLENVQTMLVREAPIFKILSWGRSDRGTRGAPEARFFWAYTSWLSVFLTTNPMRLWVLSYILDSVTCSKSSEWFTYLVVYMSKTLLFHTLSRTYNFLSVSISYRIITIFINFIIVLTLTNKCLWKHTNIFFYWPLHHIFITCTQTSLEERKIPLSIVK